MCGPHCHFAPLLTHTLRRIPQAVGVVATSEYDTSAHTASYGFNIASGRYYCNKTNRSNMPERINVVFQYRKR